MSAEATLDGSAPDHAPSSWAEERLALALEASGIAGAWDWDGQSGLIHGDARACALHGLDPELGMRGAPGKQLLIHVVPEDRPALDRALAAALAGRSALNVSYRTWPPGAEVTWVQLRGRVQRDPKGSARRLAGVALDISEQKAVEAALQDSEARFRTIADTMPQAVWSSGTDGEPDYYNRRWYALTGLREGEPYVEWSSVIHPDDREEARERWSRSLATGELFEIEYRVRMADGGWRWMLGRALPVRDPAGRISRWFGTCTDIHDMRRVAEEREVLSHELSHRIKNIFSVTGSLISLSVRGHPEAAAFAEELRGRIDALARAHELARPHSEQSRPDGGGTLFRFLAEVLSPYEPAAGQARRIAVTGDDLRFDDSAATPLALLFHELATNAAKYGALSTAQGRVTITVSGGPEGIVMRWAEQGGPVLAGEPLHEGFGSRLATISVKTQLGGSVSREWRPEGLVLEARLPARALDRRQRAGQ